MRKEELREQQPVVYRALENALKNGRVSNAYLFSGPYGTPKYETGVLLAQSILCTQSAGFACDACNTCRRVRENNYPDFIILDGRTASISKEMADDLQMKFSRTALEGGTGEKVCLIVSAENASAAAQNSLLKFLEEPGSGITAILTTDNISRVLPTIRSRCTVLSFVPLSPEAYYQAAVEKGVPEEEAALLAYIIKDKEELLSFYKSREYANALGMFRQFLNQDGMERGDLLLDYEISWRFKDADNKAAKESNMILLSAFLDLLSKFGHDVIGKESSGPAWYRNALAQAAGQKAGYAKLIKAASEQKDKVNKFNDLNLVMAQTFWMLEELKHGYGV